ncbi:MAG: FHA domain-containing protein, partial [Deltaproteobacteria bacterium]
GVEGNPQEHDLDATTAEPLAGRRKRRSPQIAERPLKETVPGLKANGVGESWDEFGGQESTNEDAEHLTLPDDGTQRVDLGAFEGSGEQQVSLQDKTLILGQDESESASLPVLVVMQGEDEGREIELVADYTSMGRGVDNDLVFPDIACSRKHAVIQREGEAYVIKDLGSGNGTIVNGRKVQQAVLNDGDEIKMGNTVLQFLLPEAKVQHRPALSTTASAPMPAGGLAGWLERALPDPRTRKLVAFGGGGVVALLLVLIVVKIASSGGGDEHKQPTKEQLQAQMQKQFQQHFEAAKNFIKEKDYKNAFLEIQLGLKIRPDSTLLKQYKEHVELEMKSSSNIKQANIALAQDDLENAVKFASQVPPESEYYKEARKLIEESRKRRLDKLAEQGRQLMEQGEFAQAILKFDEVLAQDPSHQKASLWKEQANQKLKEEEAKARRTVASRRRHSGPVRKRATSSHKKRKRGKFLDRYLAGKLDDAVIEAEAAGYSKTARDLRAFSKLYDECKRLVKNKGMFEKAIAKLRKAEKLDRKISGGRGVFHDRI